MVKAWPRSSRSSLGQSNSSSFSSHVRSQSLAPPAPVYYPSEEEFRNPLEYISKIRPEAEQFGICRIVPPKSWNPPFALNLSSFRFPTKSQAIHHLQARPPSCDPETFELEYSRFLEAHQGKKPKKRIVFEGEDLDLCRLFNAVKRCGGFEKTCKDKKWGDVYRFLKEAPKAPECSKHVLHQLYLDHLIDYEEYQQKLVEKTEKCANGKTVCMEKLSMKGSGKKRRRKGAGRMGKAGNFAEEEPGQICQQCKSGLHGEVMLLCDRCDKGWHMYCLSPPLKQVPAGNWYCLECVNSEDDRFGFVDGKMYALDAFKRINNRIRRKWLSPACTTLSHVEKRFWEIVEGKAGELQVAYGSDLDTSILGSGFPRGSDAIPPSHDNVLWKRYASSPWNLNNLPKLQGSLLRVVQDNIAGVMVPWLYIGMLFSAFCWHIEDHCFYSINYLHWGEPKCWYGVPGCKANAFEQVMKNTLPDLFDAQPDLLFQLVTMLNPSVLLQNDVPVYSLIQEPGNFVVTFPRSFHGGFNLGLNCAEAVNFAPADWLPHGGFSAGQYQLFHRASVLSHEELICVVAQNAVDSCTSGYLKKELERVFSQEKAARESLEKVGILNSSPMKPRQDPKHINSSTEDPTCVICRQYLYLSAVTCSCQPSTFVCLEHCKNLCECDYSKYCLLYRYTLAELGDIIDTVSSSELATANLKALSSEQSYVLGVSCPQSISLEEKDFDFVSTSPGVEVEVCGNFEEVSRKFRRKLRQTSMMPMIQKQLYCICRKPNDQKPMIACDQCDEWYHFECVHIRGPPPKTFYCPSCLPCNGYSYSCSLSSEKQERRYVETKPQTASLLSGTLSGKFSWKGRPRQQATLSSNGVIMLSCSHEIDIRWRKNKCLRRKARRRKQFDNLLFFHL